MADSTTHFNNTNGSSSALNKVHYVRMPVGTGASHQSTLLNRRSNSETCFFFDLQNAIRRMAELPADHCMHLDTKLSEQAQSILSIISSNSRAKPPRLINEDGEAVTFTWARPRGKSYLSIDGETIDLMEIDNQDSQRVVPLGDLEEIDLKALLAELQGSISSEV